MIQSEPKLETIDALLADVQAQGITLWVEKGALRYRARPDAMTAALREKLQAHREQIVARFASRFHVPASEAVAAASKPRFERRKRLPHETVPILAFHDVRWASIESGKLGTFFVNSAHLFVELEGVLDLQALRHAIVLLMRRHPTLTSRVIDTDEGPRFSFDPASAPPLANFDLSDVAQTERLERARALASQLVWTPFDGDREPWLRVFAIRLGEHHHVVGLMIHHFIADGWSVGIAMNELLGSHALLAQGQTPRFPALPIDYSDYVDGVNRWIRAGGMQLHRQYWREHLKGVGPTRLAPDFEVAPETRGTGATERFHVSVEVMRGVQRWAQGRKVTVHTVIVAALALAIHEQSKREDIVIITRTSGRLYPEVVGVIGAFFDGMALRVQVSPEMEFAALVAQVHATFTRSSAHQAYPLQLVKTDLLEAGDSNIAPMINLIEKPLDPPESSARGAVKPFSLPPRDAEVQPASTDTSFYIPARLDHEGLRGSLDYLTLMYRRSTIARFLSSFTTRLENVAKA